MSDFLLVVDYFFNILGQVWSFMTSNWLMSIVLLVMVLAFIIELFLIIKGQR